MYEMTQEQKDALKMFDALHQNRVSQPTFLNQPPTELGMFDNFNPWDILKSPWFWLVAIGGTMVVMSYKEVKKTHAAKLGKGYDDKSVVMYGEKR
ncbi:MAG: hypothetical protein Q8O94_02715 [bacterium]|nr:hypothetical protein [bacterium]